MICIDVVYMKFIGTFVGSSSLYMRLAESEDEWVSCTEGEEESEDEL